MRNILSIFLFLFPIHIVFIKIKNFLYDNNIINPVNVDSIVISIGNISLGGAGKTPFAIALSNFLNQRGLSVGVVTGGYGRKNSHHNFLYNHHSWKDCGDETVVLTNNLSSSIPVYVSKNKTLGAKELSRLGCNVVILDDAFQHRKLARDIDIVLLSPDELETKNQKTFPFGLLREPFYNLERADVVITTKRNLYNGQTTPPKNSLPLHTRFQEELLSSDGVSKVTTKQLSKLQNVMSLCGIGKPESFQNSLKSLNVRTKKHLTYSDHHGFSKKDVSILLSHIKQHSIQSIVCTEKDWVKLIGFKEEIKVPIYAIKLNYCLNKDIEEAVLCLL